MGMNRTYLTAFELVTDVLVIEDALDQDEDPVVLNQAKTGMWHFFLTHARLLGYFIEGRHESFKRGIPAKANNVSHLSSAKLTIRNETQFINPASTIVLKSLDLYQYGFVFDIQAYRTKMNEKEHFPVILSLLHNIHQEVEAIRIAL
jgi:hypothetical protein